MHDSSSTSNSRQWPAAALIALVLILATEAFLYARADLTMPGLFLQVKSKHDRMVSGVPPEKVVIIGDSQGFHIRTEAVAEALGLDDDEVMNYTWPFFGMEAYEYFLRGYTAHRPAPELILVNFMPSNIAQPPDKLLHRSEPIVTNRMYILLPVRSLATSLWRDGYYGILWDYLEYLCTPPSLKFRERVGQHLDTLTRGEGLTQFNDEDQRRVDEQLSQGSFVIYETHVGTEAEAEVLLAHMGDIRETADSAVLERMERFLLLAGELGSRVVLLNGPMSAKFRDLYEPTGVLDEYERVIADWEDRYPHFHAPRPLFLDLPDDCFGDPGHVNRRGEQAHKAFYVELLRGLE